MKNISIIFFLLISLPALAGLYDDILNKNPYSECTTVQCLTAIYNQRMMILDNIERQYNQHIQNINTPNYNIHYGYNAQGEYVPTSINESQIHYGYNAFGDFVPVSIGE